MKLTKDEAKALIKQEFGLPTGRLAAEGPHRYRITYGYMVITVSDDWYEHNNRIMVEIRYSSHSIVSFFNPETLEEDYEEQAKYDKEITEEKIESYNQKGG